MPQEINEANFAKLQGDVGHIKATLDQLVTDVRPLMLARSGDLAAIASIQRDLNSSHEKHREHGRRFDELDARLDEIESRFNNAKWLVLGGAAVIQLALSVFGPAILRLIGLGG